MKDDKEIREKFKAELDAQPDVSFDEWAKKNGVCLASPSSVPEKKEPKRAKNFSPRRSKVAVLGRVAAIVLPSLALAVIIFLSVFLNVLPKPSGSVDLPLYGASDAETVRIEKDEIESVDGVYLFDIPEGSVLGFATKDVLKTDRSTALSYAIEQNLIAVENGDSIDAFYMTFRFRIYDNYEFISYQNYKMLSKQIQIAGKEIFYDFQGISGSLVAYAHFKAGAYDYYLEAQGYEGITVLTESNFLNLLEKILL